MMMFTMKRDQRVSVSVTLIVAAAALLFIAPSAAVADRLVLDGKTMARLQADDAEYWHRILNDEGGKGGKGGKGMKDEPIDPPPPLSGYCEKENTGCEYKNLSHEFIYREGLGENLGLPGISFLGLGYNIFEGNPRGSDSSEVDPGFRYPVIQLRSDQSRVTADQVWLIPYGVATSAGFSCKFSSESTEISNEQEYQKQLSTEAKQKTKSSVSGAGVVKGVPVEASAKFAHSKSQKYESFSKSRSLTQTISYEARAQCTEREIYFKPYSKQELDESVLEGLKTLPPPGTFDESIEEHLDLYSQFIDAFGTHVVTRVVLGGKHIVSTELESKDVMELKRQKVSISRTLSFETSVSIGTKTGQGTQDAAAAEVKSENDAKLPFGTSGSSDDKYTVTVYNLEKDGSLPTSPPPPPPCVNKDGSASPNRPASCTSPKPTKGLGFSASFGIDRSSSSETSTEQLSRIQSKVRSRNEITIGGTPPEDGNWRAWAASVRERPMPIQYELEGLWNYMEDAAANDFIKAFFFIYGIDLLAGEETNELLQQMHFGVFDSEGVPVTSYSSSTSDNFRSIVQVEQFTPNRVQEASVVLYNGESSIAGGIDDIKTCPLGFFACGVKIRYDRNAGVDDFWDGEGIFELSMKCCNANDWQVTRDVTIQDKDPDRRSSSQYYVTAEKNCQPNFFITGGSVRYSDEDTGGGTLSLDSDALGICGLKLRCTGPKDLDAFQMVPSDLKDTDLMTKDVVVLNSINGKRERGSFESPAAVGHGVNDSKMVSPQLGGLIFPTVVGMGVNYVAAQGFFTSNEGYGIDGLSFLYREKKPDEGVQQDLYLYTYVWEGSRNFVSAFLASAIRDNISRNEEEESTELGISKDLIRGETTPFGLISTKDPQQARIVVYDFNNELYTTDLNALSILAVDNNPLLDITAGVIHPKGYIVNSIFGQQTGFKIEQEDDQTFIVHFTEVSKDFQPRFPGEFDPATRDTATRTPTTSPPTSTATGTANPSETPSERPSHNPSETPSAAPTANPSETPSGAPTSIEGEKGPTFLVFPLWFSTTSLPRHAGEVAVATKEKCLIDSCTVSVGTNARTTQDLGFAFVALKHTVENPGVVHGTINLYYDTSTDTWKAEKISGSGFTVSMSRSGYDCPNLESSGSGKRRRRLKSESDGTINRNNGGRPDFDEIIFPQTPPVKTGRNGGLYVSDFDDAIISDSIPDVGCQFPTSNSEADQNSTVSRGGVEIIFDEEFPDLPSVVVSPILNNPDHRVPGMDPIINTMGYLRFEDKPDAFSLPSAIVESISIDRAFIKSGWVNERESCTLEGAGNDQMELDRCINRNQDIDSCDNQRESLNNVTATDPLFNETQANLTACLNQAALDAEGDKATTFEPISFSFIAVGPPARP